MSVTTILPSSNTSPSRCSTGCANPSAQCIERKSRDLQIGLVNNMPDGALLATEQQFFSLLNAASGDFSVSLSLYSLPGIPRSSWAQNHIDQHYRSVESLWDAELDGIIVTGREPIAAKLSDEPYWPSFVSLLEWAREKTYSTVWSCLSAHAAVLHMDGIQRIRSSQKHSGILDSDRVGEHPIIETLPARFRLPHSRWNGLSEADLSSSGYQVLVRTDEAGVDSFVKQEQSLFLFFQSHPEYELETLQMEYRRDVIRFLRGESNKYPNVPGSYFDLQTEQALLDLQLAAGVESHHDVSSRLTAILASAEVKNSWQPIAATLYGNWLKYISAQKKTCMQKKSQKIELQPGEQSQTLVDMAGLISQ